MARIDVEADARAAFEVLKAGGSAILPMDVGYSLIGGSTPALVRIFEAKGRTPDKLNAMIGDGTLARELYVLPPERWEALEAITVDHDLPLGVIAPARMDHPLIAALDEEGRARSTRDGTVCMLLNAGPFHAAISRLSREEGHPLFGSSANRSLSGTKFRVEDIEPEVKAVADHVVDYGLRKYHLYRASSTLLDLSSMSVVRFGSCYELIRDVLARWFDFALPDPPA